MPARRETLIHFLTEAAEIEHNLVCSYLYAAFSLKSAASGDLARHQQAAVDRWRKAIVGVAVEEMGHLALVNNLLLAVGGAPHFDRPNLPVPAGYHPAGFVIRLAPLTKATLDHFIYLERPADAPVEDGKGQYRQRTPLKRVATPGDLVASTPDYDTIGDFYAEIRATLIAFAEAAGACAFIDSSAKAQLGPDTVDLPGLLVIRSLGDALAALDTIVEQGEGSSSPTEDCHFSRFLEMRREWSHLEAADAGFVPIHPAAHDPVMRRPAEGLERVWITAPRAARLVDLGNALYGVTLTLLEQAYAPATADGRRRELVTTAMALMHTLGQVGTALVQLPAGEDGGVHAGLTFAVPRNLRGGSAPPLRHLLDERLGEVRAGAAALGMAGVAAAIDTAVGRPVVRPL